MPELHDYQRAAVTHLRTNPAAGLMLDMGLGKTAVVLTALTPEHLPALVVATKRVTESVWHVEGDLWRPDLKVGRAIGAPAQRRAVLTDPSYDVVVVSRDNLAGHVEHINRGRDWATLVIDESSGFKNKMSKRWRAARKVINYGDISHVWELTGTPAPNSLLDLWAPMHLLDGGQRLGKTLTAYRNAYFNPGRRLPTGVVTRWDLAVPARVIHERIEDICLSMATEGRIELPPVTWNTVEVDMPYAVRKAYDALKSDFVVDMYELGLGEYVHTAPTAGILGNKLSQMTSGFVFTDADAGPRDITRLHSAKVDAVVEIVEGTGSPVLLAYKYQPERDALLDALKPYGVQTIESRNVIERWNEGDVPVLLAHPASVGHGLNLQHGGHTAIWPTPTWSLEEWDQMNKRLARQGQQHPVVIHMISVPDTVDGAIYAALRRKANVQDALLDHLEALV